MRKCFSILLIFLAGCACGRANQDRGVSIAVVTSDKTQTRLRLIRESPKALVKRLNTLHQGTKSEDVASLPVAEHEWIALDFDSRRREFFVLDRKNSSLMVIQDRKGYLNKIKLLYRGLSPKVKAIAYDWLRRSLYWGDPAYRSIFRLDIGHMCKRAGSCDSSPRGDKRSAGRRSRRLYPRSSSDPKRGVITLIIGEDLADPTSVAVDPINARLFWADDSTLPSIQSSDLDGRDRVFVVGGLVRPSGITLDLSKNTLYWVERLSGLSVMKKCHLGVHTCVPEQLSSVSLSRLFDMDFHKGFLITNDLAVKRLVIYDTSTEQILRQNWAGTTYGICVAAADRQPWAELPADEPSRPERQTDSIHNIRAHGALFLSSATTGIWVTAKTFAMGARPPPLIRLVRDAGLTTMALDVERGRLFYFSSRKKAIYRITLPNDIEVGQKTYPLLVVSAWLDSVTALAVDWATGHLYWADSGYHRIMVSDGHGDFATVLHFTNITQPQDLVIHSKKRLLFWTDPNKAAPRVERSDLDGYNRVVILSGHVFYEAPHALTIDFHRDVLYWSDGPYLCSSTLRGTLLMACKNRDYASTSAIKAMDMMHDFVVWTDHLGGIKLADMTSGGSPNTALSSETYHRERLFNDILFYHSSRQTEIINPCITPAGGKVRRRSFSRRTRKHRVSPTANATSDVNSFIFDAVSFSYIATSAPPVALQRRPANRSSSSSSYSSSSLSPFSPSSFSHSSPFSFSHSSPFSSSSSSLSRLRTRSLQIASSHSVALLGRGTRCSHLCLQSRTWTQCACATGYWLKADGRCTPGVLVDEFFIFADLKTGRLFRQFILLPDYYAFPVRGLRRAVDVALCSAEKRVYWLDGGSNTVHSAYLNGSHQSVVFSSTTEFNMTQITLAPRSRLLYILTSSGDVAVLSLLTRYLLVIVSHPSWAVLDVAVDETRRELFLTATWKRKRSPSQARSTVTEHGLVLRANMDGSDLRKVYTGEGQPWSIASHQPYVLWTDIERKGIYQLYVGDVTTHTNTSNQSGLDAPPLIQLIHLPDHSSPNDVIAVGDDVYFTDRTKQAILKINSENSTKVDSIGLSSLNDIAGLAYYNASLHEKPLAQERCTRLAVPLPGDRWRCLCHEDKDRRSRRDYSSYCQNTRELMYRMAIAHGLCLIKPQTHSSVHGGHLDTYVLPGTVIEVRCDPGYSMPASRRATREKRVCTHSGTWSVQSACMSDIRYTIYGNSSIGYAVFTTSSVFIVPLQVKALDVICIGGGGGGFDACNRTLRGSGQRAGMGGMSSFGHYLRAHGGQGGSKREGGLGGKGRNIFGGQGRSSSDCLGGGAAGETTPSKPCQHGSTSCPFCGVGGAPPSCSVCQQRTGGCGGGASQVGEEPEAADNFGGGATGTLGGSGGGGGGFSRKTVRVSPHEQIKVIVGAAGSPSARPAGSGVVVVGWGARLESLVESLSMKGPCKPFTHKQQEQETCPSG